jgi:septal ring factor EnvC (AmiA/AmiB activator)
VDEWGAQIWVAIVGATGGAITVIVGAWRAIARSRVDGAVRREQSALDALLADADRMRDLVVARLDTQQTRLDSLQAQLDGARETNLELRARLAELEGAVASERRLREAAEARETALATELQELRRQLRTMR